jgi:hypothetical protein
MRLLPVGICYTEAEAVSTVRESANESIAFFREKCLE